MLQCDSVVMQTDISVHQHVMYYALLECSSEQEHSFDPHRTELVVGKGTFHCGVYGTSSLMYTLLDNAACYWLDKIPSTVSWAALNFFIDGREVPCGVCNSLSECKEICAHIKMFVHAHQCY